MTDNIMDLEETNVNEENKKELNLNLDADVNQSYSDEARIREAELSHDLESQKLDFEKERYYNAIPKSDKELELIYAYKNRLLDKQIADEAYRRSPSYRRERYTVGGVLLLAIAGGIKWLWNSLKGGN